MSFNIAHRDLAGDRGEDSEIETVDELMELVKAGDLRAFWHTCQGLHTRNVRVDAARYLSWMPAHWAAHEGRVPLIFLTREFGNTF